MAYGGAPGNATAGFETIGTTIYLRDSKPRPITGASTWVDELRENASIESIIS